jgi:hypothetical protein
MSDPRRWLDPNGDSSPFERELLAREAAAAPSSDLAGKVWEKVLLGLPVGGGPADGGGTTGDWGASSGANGAVESAVSGATAAGSGSGVAGGVGAGGVLAVGAKAGAFGVTKALVIGAIAGVAVAAGTAELGSSRTKVVEPAHEAPSELAEPVTAKPAPPPSSTAIAAPADPARTVGARRPVRAVDPYERASSTPSASAARFEEAPPSDIASRIRAERLTLEQARGALHRGDPGSALRLVEGSGGGVLAQEREVLSIEALSAAGRHAEAKSRARAFVSRFPESPHNAHVSQFAR